MFAADRGAIVVLELWQQAAILLTAAALVALVVAEAPAWAKRTMLLAMLAIGARQVVHQWLVLPDAREGRAALATSDWLAAHTPPGTRIGSWNGGRIAYFTPRAIIDLDGLVNSVDYYRRCIRQPERDCVDEEKLDWIADDDSVNDAEVEERSPLMRGAHRVRRDFVIAAVFRPAGKETDGFIVWRRREP
jgi:hypothetical protein